MKLVDMSCPGCGANMKIQPENRTAVCSVCGKNVWIELSGEYAEGYDREMGRIQAQRDTEAKWKQEREEAIRQRELEEKLRKEKAEKDRIKKQLQYVCIAESVICVLFALYSFLGDVTFTQKCIRMPASFIQLALIAAVSLFFTKDRYFRQIMLACLICGVLSAFSVIYSGAMIWFVVFNVIKLIFMIRVERVSYSWKDIVSFKKGSISHE